MEKHEYFTKYLNELYALQKKAGLLSLDFEDTILLDDVPTISKVIREMRLSHFTISSKQDNIKEVLLAFAEQHISVDGIGTIFNRKFEGEALDDWSYQLKIAFHMTIR